MSILSAKNLTRHYQIKRGMFKPKGLVKALNGVSFELEAKQTLAVVGESGCGKSTLARQLTLIEQPTSGQLLIEGIDVAAMNAGERKALHSKVQMVFQNPYASLNPRKKIHTILDEPLKINSTKLCRLKLKSKIKM